MPLTFTTLSYVVGFTPRSFHKKTKPQSTKAILNEVNTKIIKCLDVLTHTVSNLKSQQFEHTLSNGHGLYSLQRINQTLQMYCNGTTIVMKPSMAK